MLINDILDLSRLESGTVVVDVSELRLEDLRGYVERTFRHVAEAKTLEFAIHFHSGLPKAIFTDAKRLQQIIKTCCPMRSSLPTMVRFRCPLFRPMPAGVTIIWN